jgi:catechol 2,3-dioxygenase-like lactoylglutathione lyase family enzyme
MLRFHHANLGVPPELDQAEGMFLVDVLGYRRMKAPPDLEDVARWFEADDGSQIHLSIDPEHRAATMAHTAIEVDDAIETRLDGAGIIYRAHERGGLRVIFCDDPAGNHWELRRSV